MSASSTHSYELVAELCTSAIASRARRLARKPYEDGAKSVSKIGSWELIGYCRGCADDGRGGLKVCAMRR